MQMQNTKLIALPTLMMLGLLMTGFAYAHWSQTLYIEGSVATGDLDWEFTVVSPSIDPENPPTPDWHCNDGFEGWTYWQGDKNVGYTTTEIDPEDSQKINITLHNVYPCYFNSISVYAHVTGSTPLIFAMVVIDGVEITATPAPVVRLDLDEDTLDDIEIWWGDSIGEQREQCEIFDEMSFWIHVLQDAPQGETLSFTISLVGVQWNEYP